MNKRSRWGGCLGVGCTVVAAVAAVLALVVSLHWPQIVAFGKRASASLSELTSVQRAVQERYPTARVSVVATRHSGLSGTALVVRVINAPALLEGTQAEIKDRARAIATLARTRVRDPKGYAAYEVVLVRQKGVGITFARSSSFSFRPDELDSHGGR